MKENFFYEVIILMLTMLFILFMGVAFEKDREHYAKLKAQDVEVYNLEMKVSKLEFDLSQATYHIKMLNKECEAE